MKSEAREEMDRKAEQRIEFGAWVAKKCRKYPKSAWWMIGFACWGIGNGDFIGTVGTGIIILVIGHLVSKW